MSEWKEVKLGELYEVHNGLSKGRQFFGSGYPFLTFSNVFNNWFLPETLESLVQSSEKERQACSIRKGDVFITRTSETLDELGMSSVALKDYPNATYNGFTKRLRPITDKVLPEYIGYYLRSKKFRSKFRAYSTMTTRASLANNDLLSMEVVLPDINAQRCIASILSSLDYKIAVNKKICENLEAQAQALFKHWFVNFAPFKDGKFVESELGLIPEGWRVGTFGEVMSITSGKRPPKKENNISGDFQIPLIGASDIMGYTNTYLYNEKILVTGRVGTHGIVQRFDYPCWPSDNTLVLKSSFYEFCYQVLRSIDYKSLNRGSTQPLISQSDIKNYLIVIPKKEILSRYEILISPLMELWKHQHKECSRLSTLRDTLLPKLMSGQIKV